MEAFLILLCSNEQETVHEQSKQTVTFSGVPLEIKTPLVFHDEVFLAFVTTHFTTNEILQPNHKCCLTLSFQL